MRIETQLIKEIQRESTKMTQEIPGEKHLALDLGKDLSGPLELVN